MKDIPRAYAVPGGVALLGWLMDVPGGRGVWRREMILGLPVWKCGVALSGRWGKHRAERALDRLRRKGVEQVILPADFLWPELARSRGMTCPDPGPLLRAMAAPLALAALERTGKVPEQACVAVLARSGSGEAARAAAQLCPRVRRLAMEEGETACLLRRQWGVPVLPPDSPADVALSFRPQARGNAPVTLRLWAGEEGLEGLALSVPLLEEEHRRELFLLAALYQAGKLGRDGVKVLDKYGK